MRLALEALDAMLAPPSGGGDKDANGSGNGNGSGGGAAGRLIGKSVLVLGLEGRPELNGVRGTVGEYDAAKGRYAVDLDGERGSLRGGPCRCVKGVRSARLRTKTSEH